MASDRNRVEITWVKQNLDNVVNSYIRSWIKI